MLIFLMVSLLVNLVLVSIYLFRRHQLRSFNEQLKHNLRVKSRSTVDFILYQKESIELADTINQLLVRIREVESQYDQLDLHHKQLIASIAHDFRTPLTSMMGYVQLLKEQHHEPSEKYLNVIEGRVKMLSHLVDDFYAMSLLDSHEYPLKMETLYPKRLCEEQAVLYYDDLSRVFSRVEINLIGDGIKVLGDTHAFERVFANIIKNAMFHGKSFFQIKDEVSDDTYILRFMNGIDVHQEISGQRIFERTYKLDQSRTTSSSGLGLAIVKELIEQMAAEISVAVSEHALVFELRFKRVH